MHLIITRLLAQILGVLLASVLLLAPRHAAAQAAPPPDSGPLDGAQMRGAMHDYFTGERQGGIWLMGAGGAGLALGAGLAFHEAPFARGFAYTVLAFGAVDLLAGVTFYRNSRSRVPRFDGQLAARPAAYRDGELTRMSRVNREMRLLEVVEISLILVGGTLTAVGALQQQELLAGIGTGLMVETGVLLIYDQLAARRALRYHDRLTRFSVSLAPGAGRTPGGALISLRMPL